MLIFVLLLEGRENGAVGISRARQRCRLLRPL